MNTTTRMAAFQASVTRFLRDQGFDAQRAAQFGPGGPTGRVAGVPGVGIKVSARQRIEVTQCLAEAEQATDSDRIPCAIIQRPGRGIEESFAVMTLRDLAALVAAAHPEGVSRTPLAPEPMTKIARDCLACAEAFEPYDRRARFCSRRCRDRWNRSQAKAAE